MGRIMKTFYYCEPCWRAGERDRPQHFSRRVESDCPPPRNCRNGIFLMTAAKYDVLGIGNAIFDVLVRTDEEFLARHRMTKGGMALIDEARALAIYGDMGRDSGTAVEMSGGSAANTIVGIAGLGARTAFVGKIKDDQIGRLYGHDIKAANVAFATVPATDGPATGCCYILVTPDGERTMNTYLGAAQELTPGDIDPAEI